MEDIFLPPGVQMRIGARSVDAPPYIAAQIRNLWARRNVCPENELEPIDDEMFRLALSAAQPQQED